MSLKIYPKMETNDEVNCILINQEQKTFKFNDVVKDVKVIAYFFSALWCHKTNELLAKIQKVYEEAKKRKFSFEIIFVSCDTDATEMLEHFKQQGNWYAIQFVQPMLKKLSYKLNITYVPCLVVCKPDESIITKNGVEEIEKLGSNVLVTWSY